MATIFIKVLKEQLSGSIASNQQIRSAAINSAIDIVNPRIDDLISEVQDDPISQEIAGGPSADNISGIVSASDANLFTYIGFDQEETPIDNLIKFLKDNTKIDKRFARFNNQTFKFEVPVQIPTVAEIDDEPSLQYPDNWNPGSWVNGITRGISGLSYYLRTRTKSGALKYNVAGSRSGSAFQVKRQIRASNNTVKANGYVGKYLSEFRRKFRDALGRFT